MSKRRNTTGDRSPYWSWVNGVNGGQEPIENNPDTLLDPESVEPAAATNFGAKFAAWMATGFPRLTDRQKQVFQAAFENQLSDALGSQRVGVSVQRYQNIKSRVRQIIAEDIGIRW